MPFSDRLLRRQEIDLRTASVRRRSSSKVAQEGSHFSLDLEGAVQRVEVVGTGQGPCSLWSRRRCTPAQRCAFTHLSWLFIVTARLQELSPRVPLITGVKDGARVSVALEDEVPVQDLSVSTGPTRRPPSPARRC